ncbi:MAG: glycosyltransferase [Actinobacteria bacterium]|nr:MAG: glycosyltransferase [Actinomycetota bacterium]
MTTTTYGLLSTYPPTQCGLATFTAALRTHLGGPGSRPKDFGVVRVVDALEPGSPPEVVHELLKGSSSSRRRAAAELNRFDVAIVQHEYGIFGGPDGEEVLALLDELTVPTIVVLHTVLVNPSARQKEILEAVVQAADAVVTMTRTAHRRLREYDVDLAKASVIPHGAHVPSQAIAARPDPQRPTILTWGLLGPGKGIEWAIEALGFLGHLNPAPTYLVVGKTHPKVLEQHGESYRDSLRARAERLGVSKQVEFNAAYLSLDMLESIVRDADVVLLPYDSPDQVTSGVLIEAVAAGKPVISSRFPHAVEMLGDGAGLLVPHRNPRAIAAALERVLSQPELKSTMAARAALLSPQLGWPAVAGQYRALAEQVLEVRETAVA